MGVLGATGYTGREVVRVLAAHPSVRLALATSESEAGGSLAVAAVWDAPDIPLVRLADADPASCDAILSCLPHGLADEWIARTGDALVVDLSADLRLPALLTEAEARPDRARWRAVADGGGTHAPARSATAAVPDSGTAALAYGLTEHHRDRIRTSRLVANPGCYPTAVLLGLAPLLRRDLIGGVVVANAASGVTGAGRSPARHLLFAEVAEDFRAYGTGNGHRHLDEMLAGAARLGPSAPEIVFTPHLLPVRRGILASLHVPLAARLDAAEALSFWQGDYEAEPFVRVLADRPPSLADVVGTNRASIGIAPVARTATPALQVFIVIDNLLKGAAGQAVQNLNLMAGWPETRGLQ
ncbi:MAG TPA: Asd/ArgC dimerization domain-containing protein [Longimicrobiales bacterium]|nr:Asd/ArgC dimerization domain-containing protein [Longimicrobiales bacterium]